MAQAVERHLALLRTAIEAHDGVLFKIVGDAVEAAFQHTGSGRGGARHATDGLAEPWPTVLGPLQVRMALHAR